MVENSNIAGDGRPPKATTTTSITTDDDKFHSNGDVTANSGGAATDCGSDGLRSQTSSRTSFTNLSQVDTDLALARTLQEQERAYMMLSMGGGIGYGRRVTGGYVHDDQDDDFDDSQDHEYDDDGDGDYDEDANDDEEDEEAVQSYDENDEDAFDVYAHSDSEDSNANRAELDPSDFPDDESYARALQDAEDREMAARLLAMAGIAEREIIDLEEEEQEDESNSQETWEEVDPDELSYEELIALGEVVGTESRGLSADTIASLPLSSYKCQKSEVAEKEPCVICRLDYEDGDGLTTLPCKHAYHSDCINNWLKIKKACPVCSTEVLTSGNS